ncbi:hypothetical protein CSPX01_02086 [Colletotrichum filicis]|nr:hypothetical protein CSPX01_02086 [Colletotrichum filicis]
MGRDAQEYPYTAQRNATQRPLAGPVPFVVRGYTSRALHTPSDPSYSDAGKPGQAYIVLHTEMCCIIRPLLDCSGTVYI